MDCARSAARLGGGFKEDPLRPVWSRHDHRIAVGGEQLAFQLVLLIGLIPVDVKEQYQSEWGGRCLALPPAQPERMDLPGLGISLRRVRQEQTDPHVAAAAIELPGSDSTPVLPQCATSRRSVNTAPT
ncbi:Uncharacterised protein [Mycobacterium tuberculosis]|nr:Uncharacterised protein [Mycobacterium tuberculosis]CNM11080.1 Uncharacterised protein [Mycobacterium tuberculosis]CNN24415.1 Uncharacterised protein [Mycobacterium tuberculosis]